MGVADYVNLSKLQTLGQRSRGDLAKPTRLERAVEKKDAKREDEKKLTTWARAVKDDDEWKDRYTGKRLKRTRELDPLRAEAHHIEPRANEDVRYDVRDGITLSFSSHDA